MIYFIRRADGTGPIKIGVSAQPGTRVRGIRYSAKRGLKGGRFADGNRLMILGVMEGEREEETRLHDCFAHLRIEGEWFNPAEDLMGFIRQHAESWDRVDDIPVRLVLPPGTHHLLRMTAAEDNMSMTRYARMVLERHLKGEVERMEIEAENAIRDMED